MLIQYSDRTMPWDSKLELRLENPMVVLRRPRQILFHNVGNTLGLQQQRNANKIQIILQATFEEIPQFL